MRVLLDVSAVPDRPVGAGVYTIELVRALLRRRDPSVDLALLARRDDGDRWAALGATEVHPLVPTARPARLAWERRVGGSVAGRIGVDVWHGPHYTMPARPGVPTVVTIHDLTFFDSPETHEPVKVAFFRHAIRSSARRAARLVCVSEHTATRLDALVIPHAPVTVAPHGVDHARFHSSGGTANDGDDDRKRLAEHGISQPFIAFVGTAEPRKNLPNLVAAFARLAGERPDLRLVLAGGDGWGLVAVRDAIAQHGVATRVVRPGYLPDATVAALYRQAAVVAYPSLAEGFGLPALEALACGAPLVTAAGTAMDEVVDDAALTVDPRDVDALADALRRALQPDVAALLRARGPQVAARCTWARSADLHVEAYAAALASKAGAAA